MPKIILTSTVPRSLDRFCRGRFIDLTSLGFDAVAVSSPGDELDNIVMREGVRAVGVPMSRRPSPLKDIISLVRLFRVFRKERPDIVHSMTPKAGLLSMMAARLAGVPVRVHTFTGLVFPTSNGILKQLLKTTDRITCSCATNVLAEGKGVRNDLIANKITSKQVEIIAHGNVRGIDLEFYKPSGKIRDQHPFTFIYVGRLAHDKGLDELIPAFIGVASCHRDCRLLLVGEDEPDDPVAKSTSVAMAGNDAITIAGFQEDIRPWMEKADCLILPSKREGFPNVVIEAGAMGLPCIVTDVNGSNEIIVEGENGLIVSPGDISALEEAMEKMLTNSAMRGRMASKAREMVAQRYDRHIVWRHLSQFYIKLASEGNVSN